VLFGLMTTKLNKLYYNFVENPLVCFLCCPRDTQNLYQSFHLKGLKACYFILSERLQLSQSYVATCHTSAFISLIFVEIGML